MEHLFEEQPMPYLGRDPAPEEIAEWARREGLRRRIASGGKNMPARERQEGYTHMVQLHGACCWLCGFSMNAYNAAQSLYPNLGEHEAPRRCLRCCIRLSQGVPLLVAGAPWYWSRPSDLKMQEIVDTLEQSRPLWEHQED